MSTSFAQLPRGLNEGEVPIRCVVMTGTGRFARARTYGNLAPRQGANGRRAGRRTRRRTSPRRCAAATAASPRNGYALGQWARHRDCLRHPGSAADARAPGGADEARLTADTASPLPACGERREPRDGLMFTARMSRRRSGAHRLVPEGRARRNLLDEAEAWLARRENGRSRRRARRTVYLRDDDAFQRAHDFLGLTMDRLFLTEDAREGISSFAERREPEFPGR